VACTAWQTQCTCRPSWAHSQLLLLQKHLQIRAGPQHSCLMHGITHDAAGLRSEQSQCHDLVLLQLAPPSPVDVLGQEDHQRSNACRYKAKPEQQTCGTIQRDETSSAGVLLLAPPAICAVHQACRCRCMRVASAKSADVEGCSCLLGLVGQGHFNCCCAALC
jgi:hypothetical protein